MTDQRKSIEAVLERRSKYFWVSIILGFFALDMSIAIYAIVMAASDPSFRPMPDYGDQSVDWEVHQQERIQSTELGWKASVKMVEPAREAIEFLVLDRHGVPVTGADGSARVYHLTRAAQQQKSEVSEIEGGRYAARLDCQRPGLWKVELRLRRSRSQESAEATGVDPNSEEVFVFESTTDFADTEHTRANPF